MVTEATAWLLGGALAAVVLAVAVLAVIGLRKSDEDSAGETARAIEFGERPGDDSTFTDPDLLMHRVLPDAELAGWSRVADQRLWPTSQLGGAS